MRKNAIFVTVLTLCTMLLITGVCFAAKTYAAKQREKDKDDGWEVTDLYDEDYTYGAVRATVSGFIVNVGVGQAFAWTDRGDEVPVMTGECTMKYRAKFTWITGTHHLWYWNQPVWSSGEFGALTQSVTKVTVLGKLCNDRGSAISGYICDIDD